VRVREHTRVTPGRDPEPVFTLEVNEEEAMYIMTMIGLGNTHQITGEGLDVYSPLRRVLVNYDGPETHRMERVRNFETAARSYVRDYPL
jgi:hypothetical protein